MHKHRRKPSNKSDETISNSTCSSAVIQLFRNFALELEEKQDRYERLVKIGRDITVESKRLIFFLHSHRRGTEDGENVLREGKTRLINIVKFQFSKILKELEDRDIHQYLRAFSFGVQEFIEAFSFYHFLVTETLLTFEEVKDFLECNSQIQTQTNVPSDGDSKDFDKIEPPLSSSPPKTLNTNWIVPHNHCIITMLDYVLGLNDLTGELMRYSINQVANGEIPAAFDICRFMTNLYSGMLSVSLNSREYSRKMFTVIQSVKKVEMACYTVRVRGSEMPKKLIFSVLEDENVCEDDTHF
ncbi:hypothetical protein V9T40_012078 [Parthenolecanium corni]|uniref:Translin-associated protein X n=1 Tax=Parthenolecanium corni TaxID=536013 RepID=A0AAN9XZ02_9HEMI